MTKIKFIEGTTQELIEWVKEDEMNEIGLIQSQEKWWEHCMEKGTSGDQVFDILGDWKKERNYLLSSLEEVQKEISELKAQIKIEIENNQGWVASLKTTQLELKQADQLREIRDGQLEELKDKLEKEKERVKELEELIKIQNDTITNSETRINEVEAKLASIKADESIGKLVVEVSEDEMED